MRIYVASSWRCDHQPQVVNALREAGHEVYDFKNPDGATGFHWSDIDPDWKQWLPDEFRSSLDHSIAVGGFRSDWSAMVASQACVLVLPCGRSAHLEAGYFVGAGKQLHIYIPEAIEPELMYRMASAVHTSLEELIEALDSEVFTRWGHALNPARASHMLS